MEKACIQNGGEGCAEVKVLSKTYTLLEKKFDENFRELKSSQYNFDNRITTAIAKLEGKMESNHHESMRAIEHGNDKIRSEIDKDYVRKESFRTVKAIVYGGASLVLIAFATAVIANFIQNT